MLTLSQCLRAVRKTAKENGHNDLHRANFDGESVRITCFACKGSVWIQHNTAKTIAAVTDNSSFTVRCEA